METIELLRINLKTSHDAFRGTVSDLTQELMDWIPPGLAHPIGERYAHVVAAEDWLINMAQGAPPWFVTTWANRTGFAEINLGGTADQARAFRAELEPLRNYADAVFANSEGYFNSLSEADMQRMIDMNAIGYGMVPFPVWASTFVIGHVHDIMGEISVLKGMLGLKGYPF